MSIFQNADLAQAQLAITRLLPHLPWPRRQEMLSDLREVPSKRPALPIRDYPEALISAFNPVAIAALPKHWLAAYYGYRQTIRRSAQFRRLQRTIQHRPHADFAMLDKVDAVVAGAILLSARPMPGPLRTQLLRRSCTDWRGAWLTAQGIVFESEVSGLLSSIANEPRLAASLWQENQDLAQPLGAVATMRSDVWSAVVALQQPDSEQWLNQVCMLANHEALAAVTALVLQPDAPTKSKARWIARLKLGHFRLAYLAVRYARFPWSDNWEILRDELMPTALSDRGQIWFHWHRDLSDSDQIAEALRQRDVDALWQTELIHHVGSPGEDLRRGVVKRLQKQPNDQEAKLALLWLEARQMIYG